jgi:serine/threonine protein kinase
MLNFKKKYFSRINNVSKINSAFIIKSAGKVFHRGKYSFDPAELIKFEIESLTRLNSIKHFPSILSSPDQTSFIMTNNGLKVTKKNIPSDWKMQILNIADSLQKEKIIHRDIKRDNILVDKNGIISLIDFGWSMIDEEYYICSRDLLDIDKKLIYDNEYALNSVFESIN